MTAQKEQIENGSPDDDAKTYYAELPPLTNDFGNSRVVARLPILAVPCGRANRHLAMRVRAVVVS